jgi:hypothetical protein
VFLHVVNREDFMTRFNNAREFFHEYLYDCRAWSKTIDMVYEIGVWGEVLWCSVARMNIHFFAIIASLKGRFLKVDECTMNKV